MRHTEIEEVKMTIGEKILFTAAVFIFLMAYAWALTFAGSLLHVSPGFIGVATLAFTIMWEVRDRR